MDRLLTLTILMLAMTLGFSLNAVVIMFVHDIGFYPRPGGLQLSGTFTGAITSLCVVNSAAFLAAGVHFCRELQRANPRVA